MRKYHGGPWNGKDVSYDLAGMPYIKLRNQSRVIPDNSLYEYKEAGPGDPCRRGDYFFVGKTPEEHLHEPA